MLIFEFDGLENVDFREFCCLFRGKDEWQEVENNIHTQSGSNLSTFCNATFFVTKTVQLKFPKKRFWNIITVLLVLHISIPSPRPSRSPT